MKTKSIFAAALWLLCLLPLHPADPQAPSLEEDANISLLTCSPGEAVWAHYGHSAVRVRDARMDICFNYGIFDFDAPHFLWRFITGQTDYILGASRTAAFLREYQAEGRTVVEQTLNLTLGEKEAVWQALWRNSLPENRTYRYNFIYDNCATRARLIIEHQLAGPVAYDSTRVFPTLRQAIRHYTRPHPWTWMGICLLLGSEADRPASFSELLFAPDVMQQAFASARILPDVLADDSCDCLPLRQSAEPLVAKTALLLDSEPVVGNDSPARPGPALVCWVVLAALALVCYGEYRQRRAILLPDLIVFGLFGLAGLIIAFLAFFSVHPLVHGNWLLLWLHPLQLCLAVALCFGRFRRSALCRCWLWLQAILCAVALAGGLFFLPQYYHPAFYPLLLCLMLRLACRLYFSRRRSA
ncbi:MAG: DUF4105 domain-containing protein [Bacteroidales bacterium]|nr:DUF4105 domain-containing protein [Bacteroidales bacterium]